jgi:hypothetical protein
MLVHVDSPLPADERRIITVQVGGRNGHGEKKMIEGLIVLVGAFGDKPRERSRPVRADRQ